jgi:hypothetical protein
MRNSKEFSQKQVIFKVLSKSYWPWKTTLKSSDVKNIDHDQYIDFFKIWLFDLSIFFQKSIYLTSVSMNKLYIFWK